MTVVIPASRAGGDDGFVLGAVGGPEEAGPEVGGALDQVARLLQVGVAGVGLMVGRVVADLAALAEKVPHRLLAAGDLLADLEEGADGVLFAEDVDEGVGVGAGAVVEGEGDGVAVARAVGDEAGAAAGAADDPDRAQSEEAGRRSPAGWPCIAGIRRRFSITRQR